MITETTVKAELVERIRAIVDRINEKLTQFGLATILFVATYRYVWDGMIGENVADIELELPEVIQNDWKLLAIFRAGLTESYCYMIGGAKDTDVPEAYKSLDHASALSCEHCGVSRNRKTTVLLHNTVDGRYVRVGSTCVEEFMGGQADRVLAAIAALDKVKKELSEPKESKPQNAYLAKDVLAMTAQHLMEGGSYIASKDAKLTGVEPTWRVIRRQLHERKEISPRARHFAETTIDEWLPQHLDRVDPTRDRAYHRNLETATQYDGDGTGAVTTESGAFQTVVSLAMFRKRHQDEGKPVSKDTTLRVGEIYTLQVQVTWRGTITPSKFSDGSVCRYVARASTGDVVTFFADPDLIITKEPTLISAKVKAFEQYRGLPQIKLSSVRPA